MGITPWHIKTDSNDSYDKKETLNDLTSADQSSAETPPSLAQKQQGLAKLKAQISSNTIDAKGALLVFVSDNDRHLPLTKDLLQCLANDNAITFVKNDQELSQYKNYCLAWQISSDIDLNGKVLQTVSPEQLKNPVAKKQLWKMLAEKHSFY